MSPKEGLLFGTLLSATDTVATIAVLRQMAVDPQVLHSLAVWCGVVQCGAVWCSVVQCGAVWYSVLMHMSLSTHVCVRVSMYACMRARVGRYIRVLCTFRHVCKYMRAQVDVGGNVGSEYAQ